jgi:hypothetical protein
VLHPLIGSLVSFFHDFGDYEARRSSHIPAEFDKFPKLKALATQLSPRKPRARVMTRRPESRTV